MRNIIILSLLTLFGGYYSQKEVLKFKISKPEYSVEIMTLDSVFRTNYKNYFKLITKEDEIIKKVTVFNASVKTAATGLFYVNFSEEGNTFIKVMIEDIMGNQRVGVFQKFKVVGPERPSIYIAGVKGDSACNIDQLIKYPTVRAYTKDLKTKLPIIGYDLVLQSDTISVLGSNFPIHLKPRLYELKEGDLLEVLNCRVQLSPFTKEEYVIRNTTIFMIQTDQYTVGKRKYINPSAR